MTSIYVSYFELVFHPCSVKKGTLAKGIACEQQPNLGNGKSHLCFAAARKWFSCLAFKKDHSHSYCWVWWGLPLQLGVETLWISQAWPLRNPDTGQCQLLESKTCSLTPANAWYINRPKYAKCRRLMGIQMRPTYIETKQFDHVRSTYWILLALETNTCLVIPVAICMSHPCSSCMERFTHLELAD